MPLPTYLRDVDLAIVHAGAGDDISAEVAARVRQVRHHVDGNLVGLVVGAKRRRPREEGAVVEAEIAVGVLGLNADARVHVVRDADRRAPAGREVVADVTEVERGAAAQVQAWMRFVLGVARCRRKRQNSGTQYCDTRRSHIRHLPTI